VQLIRVAARAASLFAFSFLVLIPASSLAVYADANPNNHGHHYGQLKHQHVPAPQPPPVPAPAPPPAPKAKPPGVTTTANNLIPAIVPVATSPDSGGASALPPVGGAIPAPQRVVAVVPAFHDPNLWVVEALLPALLIVWLIMLASSRALQKRNRAGPLPG
jgi:hypothetical protein